MTLTTISKSKKLELLGLQFDKDKLRIGPYAVRDLQDAHTSRPGDKRIVAANFIAVTIDVSAGQDGSRTVTWLSCNRCNRVFPSTSAVEDHLSREHANGERIASAGDIVASTPHPPEEPPTVGDKQTSFEARALKTREAYDALVEDERKQGRQLGIVKAAELLQIQTSTLSRRLEATGRTRQSRNRDSPQKTRAAYLKLRDQEPGISQVAAARRLGLNPATLRRRLQETDVEPQLPAQVSVARAVDPQPHAHSVASAVDPEQERRIDTYLELVEELSSSRDRWKERAERAERERDAARKKLDAVRAAVQATLPVIEQD
ncbi:hypothetical protein [Salinispora vitiensis]|uniref:hypothetical protein n=1 Tax=Salinispora vitiensis TaxID=999544 RepID=UPI000373C40F|nr:hypothetical protein [Salinispora vitiensis]